MTLLLLPIQLGKHFWPQWSLVLGRRVDYLSPTLYLTDLTIGLTILFWFVKEYRPKILEGIMNNVLSIKDYFFSRKKSVSNPKITIIHNTLYFLLLIIVCLNTIYSLNPYVSVYIWLKALEFGIFSLYIIKTKPNRHTSILVLTLAVFYSSVLGIVQTYLQRSVGGVFWILGERQFSVSTSGIARFTLCLPRVLAAIFGAKPFCRELLRSYATFPHPNVFGGFLAILLPTFVADLLRPQNASGRFIRGSALLFGLFALVLTFSRSAMLISLILMIMVLLLQQLEKIHKKITMGKYLTAVILVAVLVGVIFSCVLPLVIHATGQESFVIRQRLAVSALSMWQTSITSGVGLGNFLTALPHYLVQKTVYFLQPVHNVYLLILAETGLAGIVIIYIILRFIISGALRAIPPKISALNLFMRFYPVVAILIFGSIDHYPITLQQGRLMTAVTVGMMFMK
ncbi:hypothetical protein A2154_00760 [Candidatus Gottesmanbacteria bacterium RBG_16_43_7]|uniref:O-antigen ligase-related domain-containing protein n=1 Tax=Candidatus Gottesmanbacteria bacterium RBG_16_43_7 TaxID=1798373 RepID=A0A1F5Z8B8_9BACT|nr:MAG: hypothetical protein A2154_00760 [Candidatus Gottesmanbacteria bacterium RBG_16_43_7]